MEYKMGDIIQDVLIDMGFELIQSGWYNAEINLTLQTPETLNELFWDIYNAGYEDAERRFASGR
jgi:hypothetical protein